MVRARGKILMAQDRWGGLEIPGAQIRLKLILTGLTTMARRIIIMIQAITVHIIILRIMVIWVGRIMADIAADLMEEADIVAGTAAGLMAAAEGIAVAGITEWKSIRAGDGELKTVLRELREFSRIGNLQNGARRSHLQPVSKCRYS